MKKILIVVLLISLFGGLFFVYRARQKTPIRIGFVAGLSGRTSQLGVSARNGAELAIERKNAEGGLLGREILLLTKDNQGEPAKNLEMFTQAIGEGLKIIIGPLTSNMADSTFKAIHNKDVLVISPTVSTDAVKNRDDNFLRVIQVSSEQARGIVQEVLRGNVKSAAVVYDSSNKAYSESVYLLFKELFEAAGGTVVYVNPLKDRETLNFFHLAEEIRGTRAEALVLITSGIDAAFLCQQLSKVDYTAKIYGSNWVKTDDFISHGGEAVEGSRLVGIFEEREAGHAFLNFQTQYRARYKGEPTFSSILAYDAVQTIFSGIEQSRGVKPEAIKVAILAKKHFTGLNETFSINEFGDAVRKLSIFVVQDGAFVRLEEK